MSDVRAFIERHLQGIFDGDLESYHATTVPELTLYEWYITPHRIDGIPFHDFMMTEARQKGATPMTGTALRTEAPAPPATRTRFDLANYAEQHYAGTAIASYTLLISLATPAGVEVRSYNESRVLVRFDGQWKVVHVHKSPSWAAPFQPAR